MAIAVQVRPLPITPYRGPVVEEQADTRALGARALWRGGSIPSWSTKTRLAGSTETNNGRGSRMKLTQNQLSVLRLLYEQREKAEGLSPTEIGMQALDQGYDTASSRANPPIKKLLSLELIERFQKGNRVTYAIIPGKVDEVRQILDQHA